MKHHLTLSGVTQLDSWRTLTVHRQKLQDFRVRQAFIGDPECFKRFSFSACGLFLNSSKGLTRQDIIDLLAKLAEGARLSDTARVAFDGEVIDAFERRPIPHTALRRPIGDKVLTGGVDVIPEVHRVLHQMTELVGCVHNGLRRGYTEKPIIDMANIGIGGSFLGPQLASEALLPFAQRDMRCHYLANIGGDEFYEPASCPNAGTILFIVSSKPFGTLETLKNAQAARAWYLAQGGTEKKLYCHFIAVSSNKEAAIVFGIREENIFPVRDWVGGRYSLRSAIGLPIAISIDISNFKELLFGTYNMDQYFQTASFERNIPVLFGLLDVWYGDFWGTNSHTILPYDYYLRNITDHLQQLDVESNSKSARQDGTPVASGTRPVTWGGVGCNGRHAYHQLPHQSTQLIPADPIVPMNSYSPVADHHQQLYANCLSQSQASMFSESREEAEAELRAKGLSEVEVQRLVPHKVIPGNRPSNILVIERISTRCLGALIAMYEHKACVQNIFQSINAFDQRGVEFGKELGRGIYSRLVGSEEISAKGASAQDLTNLFCGRHRG